MGQMWSNCISKKSLMRVQSMGIPTINISMDDKIPNHWQYKKI